jgi:hypothetical protein
VAKPTDAAKQGYSGAGILIGAFVAFGQRPAGVAAGAGGAERPDAGQVVEGIARQRLGACQLIGFDGSAAVVAGASETSRIAHMSLDLLIQKPGEDVRPRRAARRECALAWARCDSLRE